MDCPDENTLVAFAAGQLDPATLETVVAHIEGCEDCSALVADAAQAVGESSDTAVTRVTQISSGPTLPRPAQASEAALLTRGTSLGRYVVLDLLGSGGLGHVYTAYDPELDRQVAIKLLRTSAGNPGSAATQRWLLREAQAMAQLSHPHVVPVHDVGTHEGGVFIAMELIRGGTFRVWLNAEPRAWRPIRDILVAAGRGLQAAHDAGLVHRDFKPGNVLVDETDNAFVVDFGLARAVAGRPDDAAPIDPLAVSGDRLLGEDLTETGAIIGTPAYMAPEQLSGGMVDARADQFSFCVTLYEALYRGRPYRGKTLRELYDATKAGPPTPPSEGNVPAWLRRATLRGLAPDPKDRFASMAELLEVLTQDLRSRRRQWLALGGTALLSAVVAGTVGFALQPEPTPQQQDAIETTVDQAREAAAKACFVYPAPDEPDTPTAYSHVLSLEQTEGPAAEAAYAQAQQLRTEFADTLVRLGDSYWERDGGAAFASDYYAAAVLFDPQREQARARMQLTPGQLSALDQRASTQSFSENELVAADVLAALAEPEEAERLQRLEAWTGREDAPVTTQVQLQRLYPEAPMWSTDPRLAQADLTPSDAEADDEPIPDSTQTPPDAAATSHRSPRGRSGRSASREVPASDGPAEAATPRDPAAAKAEVTKGRAALKQGRAGTAAEHFHRALEHDSRSLGALLGLSEVHFERGEFSKAVQFGERATRMAPGSGRARIVLGDAYFKVLRYADARRQYDRAKQLGDGRAAGRLELLDKKTGG